MALQHVRLTLPIQVQGTIAPVWTNQTGTTTYIRGILLHNTNTTTETPAVYMVDDVAGQLGTAANSNRFMKVSLAADETFVFPLPYPLILSGTNESIMALSTVGNKVNIILLGGTTTP